MRHHEDTRNALIETGLALLSNGGHSALTLRKCAAGAGVSHAAPSHHFGRIEGLLTAIASRGYDMFTEAMLAARTRTQDDPRVKLRAICCGYLTFARENEGLFSLMFNSEQIDFTDPDLRRSSAAAFEVLADTCAPFRREPKDDLGLEMAVWSLIHGYASLTRKSHMRGGGHPATHANLDAVFSWLELEC